MQNYQGLLQDDRGDKDKDKDYRHEELFGSEKTTWLTKKEADKSETLFPIRDQKETSSCLCYAVATALYNTEKELLSPGYLYTQRKNKPQEGSMYYDIANIVLNQGIVKETELTTPLKEKAINSLIITPELKTKATKHKQKSYIFMDDPSVETLGNLSNKGIATVVSIFAKSKEWSVDYPIVEDISMTPQTAPINHAIVALPYTGFKTGGIEHIKIQDSAHFGGIVFRDLSRQWIAKRVKHGMYFIDLDYAITDFPQHLRGYTWNKDLTIGSRGEEVKRLQEFLTYKGFFPHVQEPTGYFGGITRQAVKDYQASLGIKPTLGYFGPLTRTEVNKECW